MSLTIIIVLVLAIVIIIAVIASALHKAGFSVDKIKAKLLMVEMEASRTKPSTPPDTTATGPSIRQQAEDGGAITASGITVPADSAATVDQEARGKGSKIDESPIEIT